jgi:hypothetical protein
MVALTQDRDTKRRELNRHDDPQKGNTKIYAGSLVCLDAAGFAVPGATSPTLKARGRAAQLSDATALADGAIRVAVDTGCFLFDNFATDVIARADIGANAFIVDDQTVAKTNGGSTRSIAGRIIDVTTAGVWVEIR